MSVGGSERGGIRGRGFTLIEVLISTVIAMSMAALVVSAFIQTRSLITRIQAQLAMHAAVQAVHARLDRMFTSTMQTCALVVTTTARTTDAAGNVTAGDVRLILMRGKEDTEDWRSSGSVAGIRFKTDLVWDEWLWQESTGTLKAATSSPVRTVEITSLYSPGSGPNLQITDWWQSIKNLPQPRRYLDPAKPTLHLDDNIYFPRAPVAGEVAMVSAANPSDVGDFTDLQRNLRPVLQQVTAGPKSADPAFVIQLVSHDGVVTTIDDSVTSTHVFQGAWLDGRLASPLTAPQVFTSTVDPSQRSDAAKRPKLIRLRFTMWDQRAKVTQTFSFSFSLPGMAPGQPGAVP